MANELVKIDQEQMVSTINSLKDVVDWIQRNHDKGLSKGDELLKRFGSVGIQSKDDDDEVKAYIELAKKCKKMMLDKRSPVTQLMDSYRRIFTSLESDFDASGDTVVAKLQGMRNAYASKLKAIADEEDRKRREEAMKKNIEDRYRKDLADEFVNVRVEYIKSKCAAKLNQYFNAINAENIDKAAEFIQSFTELYTDEQIIGNFIEESKVSIPTGMSDNSLKIRIEVYKELAQTHSQIIKSYIRDIKNTLMQGVDAKRSMYANGVSQEDAKRREEEIKRFQEEQAQRAKKEAEDARIKAEQEAAMKAQQAQAMTLFANMGEKKDDEVKTKAKMSIQILNQQGFLDLMNFWWINEGSSLSVDDLLKASTKKMVTFAERKANAKNPEYISTPNIAYTEEIIAK